MPKRLTLLAVLLVPLAGGAALAQSAYFAVDFTWEGTAKCFDPNSPPFTLSGVPQGTKMLHFAMKDLDAPDFVHGGGAVPYRGESRVESGAFTYKGPCPPRGQHSYQWVVEAQDGGGKTLATATATKKFPPG